MNRRSTPVTAFVIDNNVLMRRLLSHILFRENGVDLSESTGKYAFDRISDRIRHDRPDLVFLGVQERHSSQMEFFYRLRSTFPCLPIVLLTELNKTGAAVAIEGLRNGALDYVSKPESRGGMVLAQHHFRKRIVPLIPIAKKMHRTARADAESKQGREVPSLPTLEVTKAKEGIFEILVFGSCLGAIPTLFNVVPSLPSSFPIPVVLIHHMPRIYTEVLAYELQKVSNMNVQEAEDGTLLEPGTIYVAPGGYHSVVKNVEGIRRITLHRGPKEHKCRPSIDVLLRSVVQEYGNRVLTVILSGGGQDGLAGALNVLHRGGVLMIESPESSPFPDLGQKVKALDSRVMELPANYMANSIKRLVQPSASSRWSRQRIMGGYSSDVVSSTLNV